MNDYTVDILIIKKIYQKEQMVRKWRISNFFAYLLGSVSWLVLIAILKSSCIVNISWYLDGLWIKPIGDSLVENLMGETAFRVEGYGCDDKLIYVAPYYASPDDNHPKLQGLTSIVDIKSWGQVSSDTISTTYTDNLNKYILFQTSDGVNMKVYKK